MIKNISFAGFENLTPMKVLVPYKNQKTVLYNVNGLVDLEGIVAILPTPNIGGDAVDLFLRGGNKITIDTENAPPALRKVLDKLA